MYNREKVYDYAKKWAYLRNPKYYNFDPVGGDCTSFVSQCIYAGIGEMNYNKEHGWYYIDGNNKSPSWSGVEFLYKFLISNRGAGPRGKETSVNKLRVGDVIQLGFNGVTFTHSTIVIKPGSSVNDTLIAAHTFDTFGKSIDEYIYDKFRCIHVN